MHKSNLFEAVRDCPHVFKDRKIFITISRDDKPSRKAEEEFNKAKKEFKNKEKIYELLGKEKHILEFYEGWADALQENIDSYLINIHIGPNKGRIYLAGIFKFDEKSIIKKFKIGKDDNDIIIVHKVDDIYGYKLPKNYIEENKENVKNLLKYNENEEDGFLIPILEAVQLFYNNYFSGSNCASR